jgi:hypothetical protein
MFRKALGGLLLVAMTLSCFTGTVFAGTIVAAPRDSVVFWDDYRCTDGDSITLAVGDYKNFVDLGWNDRVSCVVVGSGVKLVMYQKKDYGGKSKTLQSQTNNPLGAWSFGGGDWWNDTISSAKIQWK